MRTFRRLAAVLLIALAAGLLSQLYTRQREARDQEEAAQAPQGRLPEGVRPLRYDLTLRVDPDRDTFSGRVAIDIELDAPQPELFLHGERLVPERIEELRADGSRRTLDYHEMGGSGVVRLRGDGEFAAGGTRLEIDYEAPFDETLEALYLVTADGERYAFTQFEPLDARQVFPGFDEPRFKVPFDLTLEVRSDHAGVTATPEATRTAIGDGFDRLEFETTPPIPTYLLAFAVGPFDIVEGPPIPPSAIRDRAIPLRGITTRGKGDQIAFALENTANTVLALEAYFGEPYPYRKLDLAAVPDFAFGAMENVGLITYRETRLLLGNDPAITSLRGFVHVHAHELAHQWFGNLVTMPWWDDIWLNESFATWMGNAIADEVRPDLEFGRETKRNGHYVMEIDVYSESRRIREQVEGREEIASSFDWISYAKGGAFLSMLESWLGPERFRDGIRAHLLRHAWGTATVDDFIASLESVAPEEPIAEVARSFLEQRGVPEVRLASTCEDGKTRLVLHQVRHTEIGSRVDPDQRWTQPLCLRLLGADASSGSEVHCAVLDAPWTEIELATPSCPAAILPNAEAAGYTRWQLDLDGWTALVARLGELSPAEKFSVANNLSAAFRAGHVAVSAYLRLVPAVIEQPEWDVATQPIGTLRLLSDYVANEAERASLARFAAAHYRKRIRQDEASPERRKSADARLLRSEVMHLLALTLEEPDERARMAELGVAAIGFGGSGEIDRSVVPGDLLGVALAAAIAVEGRPYFDALRDAVDGSNDLTFREKALSAIGTTRDPDLAEDVRSLTFLTSLRLNEIPMIFYNQAAQREQLPALLSMMERWLPVFRRVVPETYFARLPGLFRGFCDDANRDRVEALFDLYAGDTPGLALTLSQSLERIELCQHLVDAQTGLDVPTTGL